MTKHEIITGQKSVWQIQNKLGEGDAGEIYQVALLSGGQNAILKRPHLSAFRGDTFRQSSQIRNEARIITALHEAKGFDERLHVSTPRLLDQSKPGPEYNEGNFIIIEKAEGLDLGLLSRVARKGLSSPEELDSVSTQEERSLLEEIVRTGKIPDLILIDILTRLTHYLDFIHYIVGNENGNKTTGIIWNDIKPDHLFWDPHKKNLTIIDWGNAHFLESDQTTGNRQFSWMDDFRQLFEEMGKFLQENSPELIERLNWPDHSKDKNIRAKTVDGLKTRLSATLKKESQKIEFTLSEGDKKKTAVFDLEISQEDIQKIQSQILEFGGSPDFDRSMRYIASFAAKLNRESRLDDLRKLSIWAARLPGGEADYWNLIEILTQTASQSELEQRQVMQDAIQSAITMDWEDVLWMVASALQDSPKPDWWLELIIILRRLTLGEELSAVRPLEAVWRLYYTLQSIVLNHNGYGKTDLPENRDELSIDHMQQLMNQITKEVIANWTLLEPTPPDSRLDYKAVSSILSEAINLLPEKDRAIEEVFNQPANQVEDVLLHWEKKDFIKAVESLRKVLVWDPDRIRVLVSEKLIRVSGDWLKMVQAGPQMDAVFIDWLSEVEFRAIELRSQVGKTDWLERIRESCRQLQGGIWPSDLVKEKPELMQEMPWLASFDRQEKMAVPYGDHAGESQPEPAFVTNQGVAEDKVGLNEGIALVGPLDTWVPEARGSSARVVSGLLKLTGSSPVTAAIKLMRMDQIHYALPLFREEAIILSRLEDVPGVARMIECGFIRLTDESEFPLQLGNGNPPAEGQALRVGPDSVDEFLNLIEHKIHSGWTPYLAVEQQSQDDNLLFLCDAGVTRGQYLPTMELLKMTVQVCDILEIAHARNIVYRDHKILHYYWRADHNGLYIIDWNVARYHPDGLSQTDIEMDIVQFGARGLHHILTGRTAPGALPLGPTRPEEIEQAAHSYKTQWTYDDRRLSRELQNILEQVLGGNYSRISDLRDDLKKSIIKIPTLNAEPV